MRFTACTLAGALAVGALATAPPAGAAARQLVIDRDHSSVTFSVRHLLSRVPGKFSRFEGTILFDEQAIEASNVKVKIETASIDTNVAQRDEDLRSARFFDAQRFPTLDFTSDAVKRLDGNKLRVEGKLTMHGVTKPVVLETEYLGSAKDPWGNLRYGFHATTRLNRKDFGMEWNELLEAGGFLVGDEVDISLDIEAMPAP